MVLWFWSQRSLGAKDVQGTMHVTPKLSGYDGKSNEITIIISALYPDVNARMSAYIDFIEEATCQLSDYPPSYCSGGHAAVDRHSDETAARFGDSHSTPDSSAFDVADSTIGNADAFDIPQSSGFSGEAGSIAADTIGDADTTVNGFLVSSHTTWPNNNNNTTDASSDPFSFQSLTQPSIMNQQQQQSSSSKRRSRQWMTTTTCAISATAFIFVRQVV
jgi:hypothetical protein